MEPKPIRELIWGQPVQGIVVTARIDAYEARYGKNKEKTRMDRHVFLSAEPLTMESDGCSDIDNLTIEASGECRDAFERYGLSEERIAMLCIPRVVGVIPPARPAVRVYVDTPSGVCKELGYEWEAVGEWKDRWVDQAQATVDRDVAEKAAAK